MWSARAQVSDGSALERLIAVDGFDSPLGYMTESDWRAYVALFAVRAGMVEGDSIFEVGCGAGAFLYPFNEQGYVVSGIDYSEALIHIARSAMPNRRDALNAREACVLPKDPMCDVIVANHVIHYFSSAQYASAVVSLMLEKAIRTVAISGIPDALLKKESEQVRRGLLSPAEYEMKYQGLHILYYERSWFMDLANSHGFRTQFHPHEMPGFAQNRFRFDCVMTRADR